MHANRSFIKFFFLSTLVCQLYAAVCFSVGSSDEEEMEGRGSTRSSVESGSRERDYDNELNSSSSDSEAERRKERRQERSNQRKEIRRFMRKDCPVSLRLYKAKEARDSFDAYLRADSKAGNSDGEEEEGTTIVRRKRKLLPLPSINSDSEEESQEDLSLYVFKHTKTLPDREESAAEFTGFQPASTVHEEFKSLYFVRTQKKNVYVASVGATRRLQKKLLDIGFGFNVRKRLKFTRLKRDKYEDRQSALHPDHTDKYRRPAPPKLEHGASHVYKEKAQVFTVKTGDLLTLEKGGEAVDVTFNPDSIVAHQICAIADLPAICKDIDTILAKPPAKEGKGAAIRITLEAEIVELDKNLLRILRAGTESSKLKWALLTPESLEKERKFRKFAIFPTMRTRTIPNVLFSSMEEALEKGAKQILTLPAGDAGIDELHSLTIRGVIPSSSTIGKPYNIFRTALEARFRYQMSSGKAIEFFLSNGEWYKLPTSYSIQEEFESLPKLDLSMFFDLNDDFYRDGNHKGQASEGAFNFRQAHTEKPAELIATDKLMIPHEFSGWGIEGQSFEPFDLIDVKNRHLITIKRGTNGDGISHLIWQANIAAVRLLNPLYREWTKHYVLICELLKAFYNAEHQEDFFSAVPTRSTAYGQGGCLKTLAYDILKAIYDKEETLKTKTFLPKLKEAFKKLPLPLPQLATLDTKLDSITKKVNRFFSKYEPNKITVVIGFLQDPPKKKATAKKKTASKNGKEFKVRSPSVKESVYDGLKRIEQFGYKTAISYIPYK